MLRLHPTHSMEHEFGGVAKSEFLFDMEAVHFYGLGTEMQFLSDLTRALAVSDEFVNFKLAIRQISDRRAAAFGTAARKSLQNSRRHFFTDVNLPVNHLADRFHDFFAAFLLHNVTTATGAKDTLDVKRFVVHRYHQRRQPRAQGLD